MAERTGPAPGERLPGPRLPSSGRRPPRGTALLLPFALLVVASLLWVTPAGQGSVAGRAPAPPSSLGCEVHPSVTGTPICTAPQVGPLGRGPSPPVVPSGTPQWNQTCGASTSACPLVGRQAAGMVWDAADGYEVLYGGLYDIPLAGEIEPGDTWTYTAGVWTNITATACPSGCPSPRFGVGMAYDPTDSYVVLYGGAEYWTNTFYHDTWTFAGGVWTPISPTSYPSNRYYPAMTWDAADGYVLLFGGAVSTGVPLGDTWSFLAGQWTMVSLSSSLSSRETSGMTYDAADGYVVLFGGLSGTSYRSDTWSYAAGTWTQLAPAVSPGNRALISNMMVYDNALGAVLLFGGATQPSPLTADGSTWTFRAGGWTQAAPAASPSARLGGSLADDPLDRTAVEFGGWQGSAVSDADDTWTYFPGFAPLTGALNATPGATDLGRSITFTATAYGGFPPYTLVMRFGDGGSSTSAVATHTYPAAKSYTAWLWVNDSSTGRTWATTVVTVNPLPTATSTVLPNPTDVGARTAFAAAVAGGTAPFAYAWTFGDGGNASTLAPTHAYRAVGRYTVHLWVNDSVGATARSNATVTVNTAPSVRATASPTHADVGVAVTFSATPSGGTAPFVVAWSFGDGYQGVGTYLTHSYFARGNFSVQVWANDSGGGVATTNLSVAVNATLGGPVVQILSSPTDVSTWVAMSATTWGGTSPVTDTWRYGDGYTGTGDPVQHRYFQPGTYTVRLWSNDSAGASVGATQSVVVHPLPAIVAFQGNFAPGAPNTLDLGQPLNATVVATGGTAPLTYAYTQLPPGCASADAPALVCTPASVGNWNIEAQVSDAIGRSAFANLTLFVDAALGPLAFAPDAAQVTLGSAVHFISTVTGGTVPLSYAYTGLPPGCPPTTNATFVCTPSRAGAFRTELEVRDATGAGIFANASLTVNAALLVALEVLPTNATVGETVTFSVQVSGGTGTRTPTFTNLPGGCTSLALTGGPCTVTEAGTFHVHLTVTDADGRSANASVTLTVQPAPSLLVHLLGNLWWAWITLAAGAAIALVYLWERRHRQRAARAAAQASAAEADEQLAPAPEGHALPDDQGGGRLPRELDESAPEPGPHPEGYEEEGSGGGGSPPTTTRTAASPPDLGGTLGPPSSSPPAPSPPAAAPPSSPPLHGPSTSAPAPDPTPPVKAEPRPVARPPPATAAPPSPSSAFPPTTCMICGGPLDERSFCSFCDTSWG